MNRRALLLGSVGLAGLAAAGYSRAARALTIEEVYPNSAVGLALKDRCGGQSEHAALIAELEAELARESPANGEKGGGETSRTATCPICGCPVTVTKPVK
ncbi:MAG TPA: hypothetical protein VGB82_27325 [Alphaproteobacteria bacterium]